MDLDFPIPIEDLEPGSSCKHEIIGGWWLVWQLVGKDPIEGADVGMRRFCQRDPRWRDFVFAGGKTIGQKGCYLCCAAMIASLAGYPDSPPDLALGFERAGVFSGADLQYPERISLVYELLRYDGAIDWRSAPADLDRLQEELERGPVILEVEFIAGGERPPQDQHFVLAISFTKNAQDVIIVDPWDGWERSLLDRYAMEGWDLARAIYGMRLLRVVEREE